MLTIYNETNKEIVVTRVNENGLDTYPIAIGNNVKLEPTSDLMELECEGTVYFAPTFHKNTRVDIIEDRELAVLKKKTDLFFIIISVIFIALVFLFVTQGIVFQALYIVTILFFAKGIHSLIKNENIGNVVFIER